LTAAPNGFGDLAHRHHRRNHRRGGVTGGVVAVARDLPGEAIILAALSGGAVFAWRISANMPQFNDDGIPCSA
jgi:hypothetical protein